MSGSHSSAKGHLYGCIAYLKRGTAVCGNGLRVPLGRVDDAVLTALAGNVLRPAVVMAVIDGVLEQLTPRARERDLQQSRTALQTVDREIANLTTAIATGGQLEPLLVELRLRQTRREKLVAMVDAHEDADALRFHRKTIEQKVRDHIANWHALLSTKQVQDGRQLLREVLAGPLTFTPEGRTYRFEGEAAFGGMLAGIAGVTTFMVAVRGIEPRFDG